MKVLFIITARGGSKGIPKKNIKILGKLPLIAYNIISAQKCNIKKRIIVSTDDPEIAEVALRYGAEVPFKRPKELATDEASSIDVVIHAMEWIEENDKEFYDYVCLLQPAAPFVTYKNIEEAIEIIQKNNSDTLLGVKEADMNTVFIHELDENGKLSYHYGAIQRLSSLRRQDMKKQYMLNGCIYIAKWEYMKVNKTFHGTNSEPYIMPRKQSIDIDNMEDFEMAEWMIKNKMVEDLY